MLEWLYRTTTSQTTDTDAEGKAVTREVWEAKFLWGQIVYQSAKVAPSAPPSGGAPASSPPTSSAVSPTTSISTSSPSREASTTKPGAPTKPVTLADRVARESHWLDVDRTADSRAQSPDILDAAENVQRRRSVGVLGYTLLGDTMQRGKQGEGREGKDGKGKGKRERYESTWVDVDRTEDSRAESPELDEGEVAEAVGRSSGEKKGSPLADPRNN